MEFMLPATRKKAISFVQYNKSIKPTRIALYCMRVRAGGRAGARVTRIFVFPRIRVTDECAQFQPHALVRGYAGGRPDGTVERGGGHSNRAAYWHSGVGLGTYINQLTLLIGSFELPREFLLRLSIISLIRNTTIYNQ